MDDGKKSGKPDLHDSYASAEEDRMNGILASIHLPKPHMLGRHLVLMSDYLYVVSELYATVLTYQQLVDNLKKTNDYLIAKMDHYVNYTKQFTTEGGDHEAEQSVDATSAVVDDPFDAGR